ncbi:hypothetical protein MKS88_000382 [Plasmodium brasilianum]|uniref:Uncharacterized protein n=1 Tax=Plasmodium brasilianum TaxID=5824 RepID=A0ACB9YFT9_PLABR|nr:hypothetical protein MKS88_000382 [Plasmodium brasilianum]
MEECLSLPLNILGISFFRYKSDPDFRRITRHIISKTSSLVDQKVKSKFREGCKDLANYLIQNKTAPRYHDKVIWERALFSWAKPHYSKLNKHGGCPVIIEKKDLELLNLKYEVEDFCEEQKIKEQKIPCLKKGRINGNNCNEECASKIKEYNSWINNKKMHFNDKRNLILKNCKNQPTYFPTKQCNILDTTIFKTLPECKIMHLIAPLESESKEKTNDIQEENQNTVSVPSTEENTIKEIVQNAPVDQPQSEQRTTVDQDVQRVSHSELQEPLSTGLSHTQQNTREAHDVQTEQDANSKTPSQPESKSPISPGSDTLQHLIPQVSGATDSVKTGPLYSEALVPSSSSVKYNGHPKLRGKIKNKH